MLKSLIALIFPIALAAPAIAAEPPIEVMVLGAYHFGNPGKDVNNMQVDSVLTPDKQKQLEGVANALLTFKPTRVMVEMQSDAPDFAVKSYADFTPERLKTEANEIDQIGFRIAKLAALPLVSGIDEQPKDGEPDYFPFDKVQDTAKRLGQTDVIDAANAPIKVSITRFEADQKTKSVAELLIEGNTDPIYTNMVFQYSLLRIGDKDSQSGADLNAMWYLRNAKIFAKLMMVAKPGDRVLVIFGGGHGYWLRHFARETPGFASVDPVPYLAKAVAQSR